MRYNITIVLKCESMPIYILSGENYPPNRFLPEVLPPKVETTHSRKYDFGKTFQREIFPLGKLSLEYFLLGNLRP